MPNVLDPESVDLAEVTRVLRANCGARVVGAVVGRTRLRDVVTEHLSCSQLEAEQLVDTMVGRGFLVLAQTQNEPEWVIGED